MDEPWNVYYEELFERAEEIPKQRLSRAEDMAEAAHEAHEVAVDRLVNQLDMSDAEALALTQSFGRVVKAWIKEDEYDWDALRERLEEAQEAFDPTAV